MVARHCHAAAAASMPFVVPLPSVSREHVWSRSSRSRLMLAEGRGARAADRHRARHGIRVLVGSSPERRHAGEYARRLGRTSIWPRVRHGLAAAGHVHRDAGQRALARIPVAVGVVVAPDARGDPAAGAAHVSANDRVTLLATSSVERPGSRTNRSRTAHTAQCVAAVGTREARGSWPGGAAAAEPHRARAGEPAFVRVLHAVKSSSVYTRSRPRLRRRAEIRRVAQRADGRLDARARVLAARVGLLRGRDRDLDARIFRGRDRAPHRDQSQGVVLPVKYTVKSGATLPV